MNDFTKEELGIIYLDMTIYAKRWGLLNEAQSHYELRVKIQSMIDNYCEIKTPTIVDYCCKTCNEEHIKCECKHNE